MTALAQRLKEKYFRQDHPYQIFEHEVQSYLRPDHALLDAGCGRKAPILDKFRHSAGRLVGVDVVDFGPVGEGLELHQCDLGAMPIVDCSIDVVMARSVMEHITDPLGVYAEIYRVLKPGGCFIFLTANLWDYASIVANLIPNRFHPWIVSKTEGREERDVFPVAYRTNTRRTVGRWAKQSGFE